MKAGRTAFQAGALVSLTFLLAMMPQSVLKSSALPQGARPATATLSEVRAEILWDRYGVPHIFAEDAESLFYAFGWAQMEAHGDLILRLFGQARGRGAEYWGEEYLEEDRWTWRMGVPGRGKKWYQAQAPEFRRYLDSFVAGMNAYARTHAENVAAEMRMVLPVEPADVLAAMQRAIHFSFFGSRDEIMTQAERWRPRANGAGSNAWAVAPKRSASGNALLLANPHLPWSGYFTWFEAHLNAPGVNAYGATLIGQPILGIAFNEQLGWTHTVNTIDILDLYELRLAPGEQDTAAYLWDGKPRAFEVETITLKVKLAGGKFREEKFAVKRSVHGPVVAEKDAKALAMRISGLDAPNTGQQYWEMIRARNLHEFERAVAQLQMPMFTVMYADREGHILHLFGGRVPVRPAGKWGWSGVVPGDMSATLWTRVHGYHELPRILNPASGWLQNANDPPWTTTFPPAIGAAKFPEYMAPRFMHFRAQRSARLLAEDEKISFEEFVAYKHSTRMELADRILDDLFAAVEQHGSESTKRATGVLHRWDRSTDADSRGAVLFVNFWRELNRRSRGRVFANGWKEDAPRTTPDGLADPRAAVEALEAAADAVQKDYGGLEVAWGDVYRLRRGGLDLPANGASGEYGVFRVTGYGRDDDGKFVAGGGDSFVAAVEFSNPPRAQVLIGYGNWSQPGSRHRTDQLELYAQKKLRPVWFTRAQVEQNLSAREKF